MNGYDPYANYASKYENRMAAFEKQYAPVLSRMQFQAQAQPFNQPLLGSQYAGVGKDQLAMQQFAKQASLPISGETGFVPPAIQILPEIQAQKQLAESKKTFGEKFAPLFSKMYEPKITGQEKVQDIISAKQSAESKYKAFEPSFNKLGMFYNGLKQYYGDSLESQSGMDLNSLFSKYVNTLDPKSIPSDLLGNFFDWYSKEIRPFTFAQEQGGNIYAQQQAIYSRRKQEESDKQAAENRARQLKEWAMSDEDRARRIQYEIENRARQLKEWAMADEDRARRIQNEAEDRKITFDDRLRQIARQEILDKQSAEDRARRIQYETENRARQLKEWAMADEDRARRIQNEAEDRKITFDDRLRQIARQEILDKQAAEDRARQIEWATEDRRISAEERARRNALGYR